MPAMPKNLVKPPPTLDAERALLLEGFRMIVGVDEVGVGALAGPVVAAAVALPLPVPGAVDDGALAVVAATLAEVRDSKQVRLRDQERLAGVIRSVCAPRVALGVVHVPELEALHDQAKSTRIATARAVASLPEPPDFVLLDGQVSLDVSGVPYARVAKVYNGTPSLTIAAASIVANVAYRRVMAEHASRYPAYGFERHAGYPSPAHLAALARYGPSPIHHLHHRVVRAASNEHRSDGRGASEHGRPDRYRRSRL